MPKFLFEGYMHYFKAIYTILYILLVSSSPANSQVRAAAKSRTNIELNQGTEYTVKGGLKSGVNRYHFFEKFNLKSNQSLIFENPTNTKNFFNIVLGNSESVINGKLSSLGNSNLYFFNPNGIKFGNSFNLDIGGSFFASTARVIEFSDNQKIDISSIRNSINSLGFSNEGISKITFNGDSKGIVVQGVGHTLRQNPFTLEIDKSASSVAGFSVKEGKSIALVASDIRFSGGIVEAPSGSVDIISISKGTEILHHSQ